MLNANEATTAQRELPYGVGETKEERDASRHAYGVSINNIEKELSEFLADEYASDLAVDVQSAIWSKAYSDGHSSGYHEIEHHYRELADFTRRVVNLATR